MTEQEMSQTQYNKKAAAEIFRLAADRLLDTEVKDAYEVMGMAVGMFARALEVANGVDRNVTFKMIQRVGHATIRELMEAEQRPPVVQADGQD